MTNHTSLLLLLCDQISLSMSSLQDIQHGDTILMCEVMQEATYVRHHPKKIAFIFSAMRHFAKSLEAKGYQVRYIHLDSANNTGTLYGEIERAVVDTGAKRLVVTEPGEYRQLKILQECQNSLGIEVEIRADTRFLSSINEFKQWAGKRKQLRMEYFYREMRKKYFILMEPDGEPCGGNWNFDKENRKPPSKNLTSPKRISHRKDQITIDTIELVKQYFSTHFGKLEPFHYAVTRDQALLELEHFINILLPHFGDYQDAMLMGEAYLYHSLISSYLNVGLLLPLEIIEMAESSYRKGKVKINSAEGFIRQILGWREYIRGIYWMHMPEYADLNYFNANEEIPEFYWTADTKMVCLAEAINHTRDHAYSHHIQRLMVTGNFAMLAGINVKQVQEWYLAVYSDAFEWVEMPNTLGMALFGDGGIVGSKPYAASGKYINKMSNFCSSCKFNPNQTTTDDACPFNALYWDFMDRNRSKLEKNQRLPFVYSTWDKFGAKKQNETRLKAAQTLKDIRENKL